jgi:transposase InsO family protein
MLVDDATRHKTVYVLKAKSEAAGRLKHYKASMEVKLGVRMRELWTNRGREFLNKDLGAYLEEHGITHNLSAPYTPQQNGVAERANRTLLEGMRSILYARQVRLGLWGEAAVTVAHLRNLIPRRTQDKSPHELFFGKQPSVSYLRVFGCRAHVHVPDQQRRKLEVKSIPCIFTSYDPNCKAWRFYQRQGR